MITRQVWLARWHRGRLAAARPTPAAIVPRPARSGHPDYHAGQGRPSDGGNGMSSGVAGNPEEPAQVIPGSLADLVERPLYAHLATVRPDGTPQVNPTWFRFDGEFLWLTTTASRQKNRNWQAQPVVELSIT